MPNTPTRKRSGSAKKALPSGRKMIRRHVLLLLGFYNVSLHSGIIRYAKEAGWALDDTYQRSGETPAWWSGDGILSL
ncbi:MAG: hypothetical protein RLZZ224_726, partial [Verrucomicrobiota bacterium]